MIIQVDLVITSGCEIIIELVSISKDGILWITVVEVYYY